MFLKRLLFFSPADVGFFPGQDLGILIWKIFLYPLLQLGGLPVTINQRLGIGAILKTD